jgi:amidohydrolase
MRTEIQQLSNNLFPEIRTIRRHLHMHPELSFQEVQTGKFIAEKLKDWGIPHRYGVAENGVVGLIEGKNPGKKTIALRADFDALPIQEANEVEYRSRNQGVMHACGHDVHTACLFGAARILQEMRNQFEGTIKLIFQPGEEKLPGGASIMINEGVLESPSPKAIFGQHVHPPLEVGKVGFRPGFYMASADELYLTVKGRGGHGALPHKCVDTILIFSHILTALQQIVSRNTNPITPSVLTFGQVASTGGATNIIPEEVKAQGTFRTFDEEWRADAHERMRKMVSSIAEGMGGKAELDILVGYPALYNHEEMTLQARSRAREYLGEENVVDLPQRLSAEDFSFYSQHMPACFYRLGTGNPEKGIVSPVHTDTFDIDEDALIVGSGLMAWLAVCELKETS